MSRTKSSLVGLLAVLVSSAVMAAPAMATPEWWVEGKKIPAEEQIAGSAPVTQAVAIATPKLTITCSKVLVKKGVIRPKNINDLEGFEFGECKVDGNPECKVANFQTEPLDFPLGGGGGNVSLTFRPKKGNAMASIVVSACSLAGILNVTILEIGLPCGYPEVESEATSHSLVFSEEELSVNGEASTFSGVFSWSLASGKKWSAF